MGETIFLYGAGASIFFLLAIILFAMGSKRKNRKILTKLKSRY